MLISHIFRGGILIIRKNLIRNQCYWSTILTLNAEIVIFIKNEKIDFKKHDDLLRVFVFYNTL